jgi:glycerol uptake facilitator-like aquaporin
MQPHYNVLFLCSGNSANPAVTLARAPTNTFSRIHPVDVPAFLAAQLAAAAAATALLRWLIAVLPAVAGNIVVPRP